MNNYCFYLCFLTTENTKNTKISPPEKYVHKYLRLYERKKVHTFRFFRFSVV